MTCATCRDSGWEVRDRYSWATLTPGVGYRECDQEVRPCPDCRRGRRNRDRERYERYSRRMQDKRRTDRGLQPVGALPF